MISYKDMTFCRGDGCDVFNICPRALTPAINENAIKLGLPVSQFDQPKKLKCYEPPRKIAARAPNQRGPKCRIRHIFYVDEETQKLLDFWVLHDGILSNGDLIDRMTRFCIDHKFNPTKIKNWSGK